jgi:hypothetical protein
MSNTIKTPPPPPAPSRAAPSSSTDAGREPAATAHQAIE